MKELTCYNYDQEKEVNQLKDELHASQNQVYNYKKLLQDVKHRRNMQIKDLRKIEDSRDKCITNHTKFLNENNLSWKFRNWLITNA